MRAREELYGKEPFQTVLDWKPPHARWFVEGRTNLAYNCVDRHLEKRRDKTAILFEGEPGDRREEPNPLLGDAERIALNKHLGRDIFRLTGGESASGSTRPSCRSRRRPSPRSFSGAR